uniref:Transmembrane protein n=1 Tax=Panagrellus redivivus TaxID=6233 RepID=A0A7E4ZY83_PANRE
MSDWLVMNTSHPGRQCNRSSMTPFAPGISSVLHFANRSTGKAVLGKVARIATTTTTSISATPIANTSPNATGMDANHWLLLVALVAVLALAVMCLSRKGNIAFAIGGKYASAGNATVAVTENCV